MSVWHSAEKHVSISVFIFDLHFASSKFVTTRAFVVMFKRETLQSLLLLCLFKRETLQSKFRYIKRMKSSS